MTTIFRKSGFLFFAMMAFMQAFPGNPDRSGQAGAYELLINPWARSGGFNSLNSASVQGLEAMRINAGGLAFTTGSEVLISRSEWLVGSQIGINTLGLAQNVGSDGVIGIEIMTMNFGQIPISTVDLPEGGIGEFQPQFTNIALGYSRRFTDYISAGIVVRGVNESVSNLNAMGVAFDAGVQYVTGEKEEVKFGVSLRNIGLPLRYSGDGISFLGNPEEGDYNLTVNYRTEKLEMPSLLHIGGSYDFHFTENHVLSAVANFTSNSYIRDQIGAGVEYRFKDIFMIRGAYKYSQGQLSDDNRKSGKGLSGGFTAMLPLSKEEQSSGIALDYSYRATNPFSGIHSVGVRITL